MLAYVPALVYLRQSLDATGDGLAVARQREDSVALAERRGWPVLEVVTDNDLSARGKVRRPGFERMVELIQAGAVDVVIAWDMHRLTRNRRDTLRLLEACEQAQILLALVRGSDIDMATPSGRLVADILAGVARGEIDTKSDRQRRAHQQAAQLGVRKSGRRPFGYEPDGVVVRLVEARALKAGYEALLSGAKLGAIARSWNEAGLTTGQAGWKGERRGVASPWRTHSVRTVLLNARNAGLRAYRGEVVGPAVWPAIVSEETWRAAVAVLRDPGRRTAPKSPAAALLTGCALCGVCRGVVHGGATVRKVRTYRCRDHYGHLARQAEPVEAYVTAVVLARLARPDAADLLVDRRRPDVDVLRGDAVALRARLEELAAAFADGEVTRSQLRIGSAKARTRLAEVEAEMADAGRVSVLGPLLAAADVAAHWEGMSLAARRGVVGALAEVVLLPPGRGVRTFRPETVQICWHEG
jgi:DNA invertase Pin-like site-specific DNA recombinase